MYSSKKIKVLVIDDSLLFRETVARGIGTDKGIEVVGTAADPYQARDKIIELEPDVLTLDIEMPKMSGIEFLKKLMPQYPLPVVVVSALSDNVFKALDAGAVDFVAKPGGLKTSGMEIFINELIVKIKIASLAKVSIHKNEYINEIADKCNCVVREEMIIAIGASTGGTEALYDIIKSMPRDMIGIVIAQHMPPLFTKMYAERLNNSCKMQVEEAKHGDLITPGKVLIAPGDYHMKVNKKGKSYIVELSKEDKVNGHRPSVDVLFNSVAEKAGSKSIGVILTGMGYDGAKGLMNMKKKGALTIGQDEKSCIVYGMPKVAYDIGAVLEQIPLCKIPQRILSYIKWR